MAKERYIQGKQDKAHHVGLRCIRRSEQIMIDRLEEWKKEPTFEAEGAVWYRAKKTERDCE